MRDGQEWHRWFAWKPVTLLGDRKTVWLEFIERRKDFNEEWKTYHWEYREIEK